MPVKTAADTCSLTWSRPFIPCSSFARTSASASAAFVAVVWHTKIPHGVYQQLIKQMWVVCVCVCGCGCVCVGKCEEAIPCSCRCLALAFCSCSCFWYVHKFIILKVIGFVLQQRQPRSQRPHARPGKSHILRQNNKKIYIFSCAPTRTMNFEEKYVQAEDAGGERKQADGDGRRDGVWEWRTSQSQLQHMVGPGSRVVRQWTLDIGQQQKPWQKLEQRLEQGHCLQS